MIENIEEIRPQVEVEALLAIAISVLTLPGHLMMFRPNPWRVIGYRLQAPIGSVTLVGVLKFPVKY